MAQEKKEKYAEPRGEKRQRESRRQLCQGCGEGRAIRKVEGNYTKEAARVWHMKSKGKLCQEGGGGRKPRKVEGNYAKGGSKVKQWKSRGKLC